MTTQPEALRLADKMSSYSLSSGYAWHCHKAAAELRRLHEVNQELVAALNKACLWHSNPKQWLDQAYAAIYRSEGETK
jgi:hypothetical protein